MAYDKFLIAPFSTGLQKDLRPFLIPEDAFQQVNNALIFRGRVIKRFGSQYSGNPKTANNSRLRWILAAQTDGSGDYGPAVAVPPAMSSAAGIGAQFTVGTETYTVYQAAGAMLATSGSGTFDTTTGILTLTGAPATTDIYYYSGLPVMGLAQYEIGPVNDQPAFAFDTRQPYKFNGTSWERQDSSITSAPLFTGTNNDYFWSTNWTGILTSDTVLFTTNYVDDIYTWDGTDWNQFNPLGTPAVHTEFTTSGWYVQTSRIVVVFKNRLVLLSTKEQQGADLIEYPQRARWCALGSPFAPGAWLIPKTSFGGINAFGGNFNDAATKERIISAEFIKDRLIVYFETSTYELVYTNNQVLPFVWQKINTELGAVGTFSTVPFDKAVLGIGKSGVHACSGANVERIDQKIPDEVFDFKVKDNAFNRIAGIRDYQPELVYWTYINGTAEQFQNFPTTVMVYNYQNQTWSFNSDCIMTWGYFEQQSDLIWQEATDTWEVANYEWNSNVEPAKSRQVIFGNQQGFVCIVRQDLSRNSGNMQISQMTQLGTSVWQLTIKDHNLTQSYPNEDWILLENMVGITVNPASSSIFEILTIDSKDTLSIKTQLPGTTTDALSGVYLGKGTAARVSRIDVISKQWNPYLQKGNDVYLAKIVFGVSTTHLGEIQVDYMNDDSQLNMVDLSGSSGTNAIIGTNVLEMFIYHGYDTEGSERLWHPVYFQGQGNCVQIRIYYSDVQMGDRLSSLEELEIDGIILCTLPASMRFV